MVSIIACTMRPTFMENIFNNYERQVSVKKEMIIILNRDDMDIRKWRNKAKDYHNVVVFQLPEEYTLAKCLNVAIDKANHKMIAKFDDDDYYAPHFLKEAVDAIHDGKAPIVGKKTSYVYFEGEKALMLYRKGNEGKYCGKLKGGTLVFEKSVWDKVKFPETRARGCDAHFLSRCSRHGFKIYSVSKHNYVCVRRKDLNSHTQQTSTESYMSRCKLIRHTDNYIPFITKNM